MTSGFDAYGALRYRDYRHFLAGGVLASIGLEIQAVVVGWELYELTGSALILGFTGLAQFLPVLLLALPAGQAADIFPRKRLFQFAQLIILLGSLGLMTLSLSTGPVWLFLACLVLVGIGRAFTAPARTALFPQLIPVEMIPNGVTWNSTGWQFANVSGPAGGGLLLMLVPPWTAYLFSACCSLLCVILLHDLQPRLQGRPSTGRTLAGLVAGIRFLRQTRVLFAALALDLFAVLLGGAVALLPIFARDILHVDAVGLGVLRAAPALGAICMAIYLSHSRPMERPGRTMLIAVAGFGAATLIFAISQSFVLSFVMLALTGALDNISVVVRGTLVQLLTPDEMRGRVAAVNTVFISSSNELGMFESGVTAEWFGPVGSVLIGGAGTILVVLIAAIKAPELLALGPFHSLKSTCVPKAGDGNLQSERTEESPKECAKPA